MHGLRCAANTGVISYVLLPQLLWLWCAVAAGHVAANAVCEGAAALHAALTF